MPGSATKVSVSPLKSLLPEDDVDVEDQTAGAEDDEDPRLSAAALCVSLRFTGGNPNSEWFTPEYTHQCFEGEFIPGYQPFERDILQKFLQIYAKDKANDGNRGGLLMAPRHASHSHFAEALEYLRIKVEVAPSCAICKVHFETQPKFPQSPSSAEHPSKRRRIAGSVGKATFSVIQSQNAKTPQVTEEIASPMDIDSKPYVESNPAQVPLSELLPCLEKMLPDIVENRDVRNEYLAKPFGEVLHEYDKGDDHFCISLANGNGTMGVESYHNSVQRLALGWIETADHIDVTYQPHAGQYWQILYLYQKHGSEKHSLAGYMTLWTITSLLSRPVPGLILRITQALLLPHHQRCGHGQEMMRVIYKYAQGEYDGILKVTNNDSKVVYPIVQVNVEDPSPGFKSLRDLVDYSIFLENQEWQDLLLQSAAAEATKSSESSPYCLEESRLRDIASKAKITPRQVQIVYELFCLRKVQIVQKQHATSDDSEEQTFRLYVKERLYKENKSIISALPSKDEMRKELSQLYSELMYHYRRILEKVHPDFSPKPP